MVGFAYSDVYRNARAGGSRHVATRVARARRRATATTDARARCASRGMGACASTPARAPARAIEVVSRTSSSASARDADVGARASSRDDDDGEATPRARDADARATATRTRATVARRDDDADARAETATETTTTPTTTETERTDAATIEALRRTLEATLPVSSTRAMTGAGWTSTTTKERTYRGGAATQSTSSSTRARATTTTTMNADVDANNKSDDEDAKVKVEARPTVDREAAARRAKRELRKQARTAAAAREASRRREDDGERMKEVVTPRSNLRIKLPPRSPSGQKDATRWIAAGKDSYETRLDQLLAVAERAGTTAERVRDEINDLGVRVDELNLKPVAPWEERGSSWAGDRHSKSARSERSSSAGTILNPKNKNSREMRVKFENVSNNGEGSTPTSPENPPKVVTSVLRSDLVRSMGEMSTNEKLERLGLKTVLEDEGSASDDYAPVGTPVTMRRSISTPASNRRVWHERSSAKSKSIYSDEDDYGFAPPPSVGSYRADAHGRESPGNYVEKLKAQAKLARAESAKSWKPGVGVRFGAQL